MFESAINRTRGLYIYKKSPIVLYKESTSHLTVHLRPVEFVQLNNDPQTNNDILFVVHLDQFEHEVEDSADILFEVLVCRNTMHDLQHKFT